MDIRRMRVVSFATLTVAATAIPRVADASNGLVVETVSDYTFMCGGVHDCDIVNANSNGDAFINGMGTTYWSVLKHYTNNSVWDTDFYDKEMTGGTYDNDTTNFDPSGATISFLYAHGECSDISYTGCSHDSDCGASAYCSGGSPLIHITRLCINKQSRTVVTSSSTNHHGNIVTYGQTYGQSTALSFALGESANSGNWGGAGTNGGTNVAVIINSCGFRPMYLFSGTDRMFAGVHSMMVTAPVAAYSMLFGRYFSDTSDWSARGATYASNIMTNMSAAVEEAWLNPTMVQYGFAGNATYDDGMHAIISKDSTGSRSAWHVTTETWWDARNDTYDAWGATNATANWTCNWDCSTYDWHTP